MCLSAAFHGMLSIAGLGPGPTISLKGIYVIHNLNGACVGVSPGVLVVEAVDVGHEEKHVCVDHGGRDRREGIVVAKLNFRNGQGIVFVDNGNDTHVHELVECILSI